MRVMRVLGKYGKSHKMESVHYRRIKELLAVLFAVTLENNGDSFGSDTLHALVKFLHPEGFSLSVVKRSFKCTRHGE